MSVTLADRLLEQALLPPVANPVRPDPPRRRRAAQHLADEVDALLEREPLEGVDAASRRTGSAGRSGPARRGAGCAAARRTGRPRRCSSTHSLTDGDPGAHARCSGRRGGTAWPRRPARSGRRLPGPRAPCRRRRGRRAARGRWRSSRAWRGRAASPPRRRARSGAAAPARGRSSRPDPAEHAPLVTERLRHQRGLGQDLRHAGVELAADRAEQRATGHGWRERRIWAKVGQSAGRKCDSDSDLRTVWPEVPRELLVRARPGWSVLAEDPDLLGAEPEVDRGRVDEQGAEAIADYAQRDICGCSRCCIAIRSSAFLTAGDRWVCGGRATTVPR